jgi:hypothetical protein
MYVVRDPRTNSVVAYCTRKADAIAIIRAEPVLRLEQR